MNGVWVRLKTQTAKQKFHAKPVKDEDGFFASRAEHRRWLQLKRLAAGGIIRDLVRQPKFPLWTVNLSGHRVAVTIGNRKSSYIADFAYHDEEGRYVVEDVKGIDLPMGRLKRAIVKASLGIDVVVISKGR